MSNEPNKWIKTYRSDGNPVEEQQDQQSQLQQQDDNYNFDRKIQKQILDKLEELSKRVERLEVEEGWSADSHIVSDISSNFVLDGLVLC